MTTQGATERSAKATDGRSEVAGHSVSLRSVYIVSLPHSHSLIGKMSSVLILSPLGDVSSFLKITSSGFSIGVAKVDVNGVSVDDLLNSSVGSSQAGATELLLPLQKQYLTH